ncbi:MAG: uracil-DNA glycosylase [Maledivibacter sp.]|nr:uracil-DNA glycosylase [Maledivibacter sp.]
MSQRDRIDCFKCKYFYITWDQNSPRGCRYFGFKTSLIPSIAVLRSSGKKCGAFAVKSKNL